MNFLLVHNFKVTILYTKFWCKLCMFWGLLCLLLNSARRVVHRALQKLSLEKCSYHFLLSPPSIFFLILLLLLGQDKTRNRKNYIIKSVTVLQQSGEKPSR